MDYMPGLVGVEQSTLNIRNKLVNLVYHPYGRKIDKQTVYGLTREEHAQLKELLESKGVGHKVLDIEVQHVDEDLKRAQEYIRRREAE